MGYCGWLMDRKHSICRHRTKGGGCSYIHYGCPYGPRDSKPTVENCVETVKAEVEVSWPEQTICADGDNEE